MATRAMTMLAVAALALVAAAAPAAAVGPEPAARTVAARIRSHDDRAVQQALDVLGQAVNPVLIVGLEEMRAIFASAGAVDAPSGVIAFRAPGDTRDPNIYVNRNAGVYRDAVHKPSPLSILKLAATLVHEEVHNTDRDFAAYRLQADFVRSRFDSLPRRQRRAAREYLQRLEARATGLARAEDRPGIPR